MILFIGIFRYKLFNVFCCVFFMKDKNLHQKVRNYGLASAVALGIGSGINGYSQINDYEMVHQNSLDKKIENVCSYENNFANYKPLITSNDTVFENYVMPIIFGAFGLLGPVCILGMLISRNIEERKKEKLNKRGRE